VPVPELVERAAVLLAGATNPIIILGDGVVVSGAQAALTHVAEQLGAEVWGADSSEVAIDSRHPLYRGLLGHMFGEVSAAAVDETSMLDVFLHALAARAPEDLIVFDEGLTATPAISAHLPARTPGHWFLTRGGSLGVGIPGAIGAKLAHPHRAVVGFTGDGGSMYTIQALATAARYNIGAKFVICNNHRYRLLDDNIAQYWRERGIEQHEFPRSFDLSAPDIGFVDIARGCRVDAVRVEKPNQVDEAIE